MCTLLTSTGAQNTVSVCVLNSGDRCCTKVRTKCRYAEEWGAPDFTKSAAKSFRSNNVHQSRVRILVFILLDHHFLRENVLGTMWLVPVFLWDLENSAVCPLTLRNASTAGLLTLLGLDKVGLSRLNYSLGRVHIFSKPQTRKHDMTSVLLGKAK